MSGTATQAAAHEDWNLLLSFFPHNSRELAAETGALQALRKDNSPENLTCTFLLHLGFGHALPEIGVTPLSWTLQLALRRLDRSLTIV